MMRQSNDSADRRAEEAALWCLRMADGTLVRQDHDALDRWLACDAANAAAFEDAVGIWQAIDATTVMPEMIQFRAQAVESLRDANARRWTRPGMARWRLPSALAACFALVMMLGLVFLYDPVRSYRTDIGERRIVTLTDGTRLTLDGASRVDVRMGSDSRRLKLLAGRAKFDVARDPMRPLSVLAGNRLTVATGTSFSVELLSGQMRVVLYEGSVEVLDAPAGQRPALAGVARNSKGRLVPGRELIASTVDDRARIADTDIARSTTWEAGSMTFDGEPLSLAVERINRDARTPLIIDDRAIANYRISGVFVSGDVHAFLEGVSALYPVETISRDGTILLKRRS